MQCVHLFLFQWNEIRVFMLTESFFSMQHIGKPADDVQEEFLIIRSKHSVYVHMWMLINKQTVLTLQFDSVMKLRNDSKCCCRLQKLLKRNTPVTSNFLRNTTLPTIHCKTLQNAPPVFLQVSWLSERFLMSQSLILQRWTK